MENNCLRLATPGTYRVVDNKGYIEVDKDAVILYASNHESISSKLKEAGIEDSLEGQKVELFLLFPDINSPI